MFSPIRLLQELQSARRYYRDEESAEKYFNGQVKALQWIQDTAGYEEIKRYWQRVWELNVLRIAEIDPRNMEEVAKVQWKLKQAQDFIMFLENVVL